MSTPSAVDTYINQAPQPARQLLIQIRQLIRSLAPSAVEVMSYGIPTFDLQGKHLVHFAAFTHHIGFFPTPSAIAAFAPKLTDYTTAKGTVQFPLDQPLPVALIEEMVKFRIAQVEQSK